MKIIFTAFLFLSTTIYSDLLAQNWHSLGPAGVPVSICTSSKYILVGTSHSGIAKSSDNGVTWKYVQGIPCGTSPNNMVMCIEHDPQNLQNVYAGQGPNETATGNGFFKSTDGGETWEANNSGLPQWPAIRQISINPFHPNEIYLYCRYNGGPGIYKSIDYGETWNLFFNEYINSTLIFNNEDSTKQYLFVRDGTIYQLNDSSYSEITTSTNYFSTSEPIGTFINSKKGYFYYANGSNLYKRTSDSDWVSILSNLQTDSIKFNSILSTDIDQRNGTIYVCTDKNVLTSSNDGGSWLINEGFDNMKVSVDSSEAILIGFKGLYSSVNNGNQWLKLSEGLNISSVSESSVATKAGKYTIYMIGRDNIYSGNLLFKTTNEGASWLKLELPDQIIPSAIKANPLNPDVVYLGSSLNPGLYKSYDGGITWEKIRPSIAVDDIEISLNDTSHVLVGGSQSLLESFDSGNFWDNLYLNLKSDSYGVNIVKISRKNPVMICAGINSNSFDVTGFYITTGGNVWERKVNGLSQDMDHIILTAIAIDPYNDNNIFIGNYSGVYKTSDMGNHWLPCIGIGYVSDIKIAPDNPDIIFATGHSMAYGYNGLGLYLSKDAGNSWEQVSFPGFSDESRTSIDILPDSNKYKVFVGTDSYGYFEGEYPREILLPMQPLIISPNRATNVERKATLIWRSSDLAMEYNIQISEDSLFASVVIDTTLKDTALQLISPLSANTLFYWHVNAININGDSSCSLTANFSTGTAVGVKDNMNGIPKVFVLSQNYPNPFNPSTIINYEVPNTGLVTIKIYDVLGRETETLVNEVKSPGRYNVKFDGSYLASGLYFYRITSGNFTAIKKMLLIK